jgi:ribulose-bisphosphate carboxylase large chain
VIEARYRVLAPPSEISARAFELCVEQTLEFPAELASSEARERCLGRVIDIQLIDGELGGEGGKETDAEGGRRRFELRIGFPEEIAQLRSPASSGDPRHLAVDLPQLLNVLFGNISLKPDIRLVALELPPSILDGLPGPRFGRTGLFSRAGVHDRPLVGSALKPMGRTVRELAKLAAVLAEGGLDVVKDDHGLCDQPFAPFRERVQRCAQAVREAGERRGRSCLYMPNVTAPAPLLAQRLRVAKSAGAGGVVMAPGLTGFDALRAAAEDAAFDLPILAHPAMLGAYVLHPDHGIAAGLLLGTLLRLAGADGVIFPSHTGRFGTPEADCRAIVEAAQQPLPGIRPCVPVAAGGMRLSDVGRIVPFYGKGALLLIGGDLHRERNLGDACRRFVSAVGEASREAATKA